MLVAFSNGRVFSTSMLRKRGRSTPSNPGRFTMKKKRFSVEQIVAVLKQAELGFRPRI